MSLVTIAVVVAGLWLGNILSFVGLQSPLSCFNKAKVEVVETPVAAVENADAAVVDTPAPAETNAE